MKKWGLPALVGLMILAAVSFWGFKEYRNRVTLETYLNNKYQMSFYTLISRVQSMEVLLSKTQAVGGSPDDTVIFSEIWLQSEGARESLTQLPVSSQVISRTAKFLTQAGDYARVKAREINNGENLTAEEYKTLNSLYKQAEQLNRELHDMEKKVADGKLSIGELARAAKEDLEKGGPSSAAGNFQSIDRDMQGFPTLIYDGPFSDHLDKAQPSGLGNKTINADEARNIIRDFVDNQQDNAYRVQVTGRTKERIPGYQVELLSQKGEGDKRIYASVSEKGGHVIWYLDNRVIGAPRLTLEKCKEKATEFLESRGYKNMVGIYHQKQDGRVVFNFTPEKEGVIIYPDQVKVNVAMDNGQVVGCDARGYLMAHKEREMPTPKISASEAQAKVNQRMEITGNRLCVIPSDSGKERFCYEITGQINGETYLVYINAMTGKTDQVLKLIESSEGTLTM